MRDPRLPLLPHLSEEAVRASYEAAPGNEIASGKFASPESSAALAANIWGYFLTAPEALPALPGCGDLAWPARCVRLEALAPFPWRGGRTPCLDALIETDAAFIGIESKRYEPFRAKGAADWSEAYWRPVWGERMRLYCALRDETRAQPASFSHLDAAQLIKHAFGLRTLAERSGKRAMLFYAFAEPLAWPDGTPVKREAIERHRREAERFAAAVAGDQVSFSWSSYADLLRHWRSEPAVRAHAEAVLGAFSL